MPLYALAYFLIANEGAGHIQQKSNDRFYQIRASHGYNVGRYFFIEPSTKGELYIRRPVLCKVHGKSEKIFKNRKRAFGRFREHLGDFGRFRFLN